MTAPKDTDADGELDQLRRTLDSRYDDIKSGKVKLIPGDEVVAELRQRSAKRSGASRLSMEEIDAVIALSRKERRNRQS